MQPVVDEHGGGSLAHAVGSRASVGERGRGLRPHARNKIPWQAMRTTAFCSDCSAKRCQKELAE